MRALSPKTLRRIREILVRARLLGELGTEADDLRDEIDRALTRRRGVAERRTGNSDANVRAALGVRAEGVCECGCGAVFTEFNPAQVDHFFGRGKGRPPQSEANCWLITLACHRAKTDLHPSAQAWFIAFIAHATKHGFFAESKRAKDRLAFIETRTAFAAGGAR